MKRTQRPIQKLKLPKMAKRIDRIFSQIAVIHSQHRLAHMLGIFDISTAAQTVFQQTYLALSLINL